MTVARTAFAANWWLTSRWLARVRRQPRPRDLALGEPRFLSAVVRLPDGIREALAEAALELARVQPEHYLYPPASIHLTVLALAEMPGVEREVEAVARRHPSFAVEVGGLNLSPDTVFAELHPRGSGLHALRRDLRVSESSEHGPVSRWLRRRIAHANVIRFTAPVDPRLVAGAGKLRRVRYGRFEVGEIELVRTDKVLSAAGTRTLARCPLGQQPAHPG